MATKFRSSMTSQQGNDPAGIVQCRIVNVNVVKWTVDVVTQYDRKHYFNIQISSPYLHHSTGEGLSIFPEVGATCMIALPGDSSPPFVLCFIMAHEVVDGATDDAPLGTTSHADPQANGTDASFAGGRDRAIPGSIYLKTRDGNFVTLHRGGVVAIGATELAQRMYIPLGNLIVDFSENYEHHNQGGSLKWGIQDGPTDDKLPSQFVQTFRVFASDRYADIKLATGKVFHPLPEPDGTALATAGIDPQSVDAPIIFELAVSPKGFIAESGDAANDATVKQSVMKFTFDRKGNTLLRVEGNVVYQMKKKLTIQVSDTFSISSDTSGQMKASSGIDIDGGSYTHVKGTIVRLGAGALPVARLGDLVSTPIALQPVLLTFPIPGVAIVPGVPIPAILTSVGPIPGFIVTGNGSVLA